MSQQRSIFLSERYTLAAKSIAQGHGKISWSGHDPELLARTYQSPFKQNIDEGEMQRLQAVHAIFKDGALIFADPALAPKNGAEVVVTYIEESPTETPSNGDLLSALRGRGTGERLVEKLLQARREDREHDERSYRHLRP
jgi:hypothetical protein